MELSELANLDLEWRTSSFSDEGSTSRVEVAFLPDGGVALRDVNNVEHPIHLYTAAEWDAFVAGVRAGEFDVPDEADQ